MPARRDRLGAATVATFALAGGLLSAAGAIASLWLSDVPEHCEFDEIERSWQNTWTSCKELHPGGSAYYLADNYQRVGVVLAVMLLALPILVLAVRLGRLRLARPASGRRDGRLAGRRDSLRVVLAAAGLVPVVYLLLWLALSGLAPPGARLLPDSPWSGLLAWPPVAALLLASTAVATWRRPAGWSPRPRADRPTTSTTCRHWTLIVPPALGVVVLLLWNVVMVLNFFYLPLLFWGLVVGWFAFVMTLGAPTVCLTARNLAASPEPTKVAAGRRLAEVPPGFAGATGFLLVAGSALSVEGRGLYALQNLGAYALATIVTVLIVPPGLLLLGLAAGLQDADAPTRQVQLRALVRTSLAAGCTVGLLAPTDDGWAWFSPAVVVAAALTAVVALFAGATAPWLAAIFSGPSGSGPGSATPTPGQPSG